MKRVLLLAFGIVLGAGLVFGQAGYIGLFTDIAHTSCNMYITAAGGVKRIYVYHMMARETTACRFAIKTTGLVGGQEECDLTGITYYFTLVLGDPFFEPPYDDDNAGVAFAYGSCNTTGAIYLMRITLTCAVGMTPPPACSSLETVPAPDAPTGTIEVVDCEDRMLFGGGLRFAINPNPTCACGDVLPAHESTWGKVKALYN